MKNTLANAARGFRSELQSLIPLGPNPDSCRKLLSECIDDLKGPVYNHNRATGSLWVMESFLNCIAHPSSATKISEVFNVLLEENDIFDLFVKEFSAFVDGNRSQEKLYLNIRIEPRLSLLTKLLSLTSVEPNEEQGRKLWDYLVGEHALNQGERDHAFTRLRTLLNIDVSSPSLHIKSDMLTTAAYIIICAKMCFRTLSYPAGPVYFFERTCFPKNRHKSF